MAVINILVADDIKREAEVVLDGVGLNMSSAITIFLKQVIQTRGIPFEITTDRLESQTDH